MDDWSSPRPLAELKSADFDTPGCVFESEGLRYRTTGERVGQGGMGHAYQVDLQKPGEPHPFVINALWRKWLDTAEAGTIKYVEEAKSGKAAPVSN